MDLRRSGALCAVGAAVAAVGAIVTATLRSSESGHLARYPYSVTAFRVTEVVWTLTHVLTFLGALAVARSGLVRPTRGTRVAMAAMLSGMALLVPSELGFVLAARDHDDDTLPNALGGGIGIGAVLAGLGFTAVGVAVLTSRRWRGWGRWTPLACGLFVLLVLLPVQAARPSVFLWPVAGWSACLGLLGIALVAQQHPRAGRRTATGGAVPAALSGKGTG
jgi:hypothetical protein